MNISFRDQVVLVAGGTGGLGKSVALAFLEEDAKVIVTYRHEAEFLTLKTAAGEKASSLEGVAVDVTDMVAVADLMQNITSNHKRLDIVVNAVGGYAGGIRLWDLEPKLFDQMLSLNLRSGYALAHAAVPAMLPRKSGAIVNVCAKAAVDHGAGASAYAASKAASLAMMDSLAADLKGTGIRVNSVLPSIIDTAANRAAMPDAAFATWPKPEDIAKVILFLCSEQAIVIHGAAIPVYGQS